MTQSEPVQLLAMRHGAAGSAASDRERPLSDEGRAQVGRMAERLRDELGARPERLFTSPYPRAAQTAAIVGGILQVSVEPLTELSAGELTASSLLPVLRALAPAAHRLMIVGHAPDLANLVTDLTEASHLTLGTAAVAQLEGIELDRGSLRLIRVWAPGSR